MVAEAAERTGQDTFDLCRLEAFLTTRLSALAGPMRISPIGGGQSNPTFLVRFGESEMVLRKRPAGDVLPSAHAVDREFRVQAALADTPVQVPRMLLFHGENDVVGTPFYIMERVRGRVFDDNALRAALKPERRTMYEELARALAEIHRVDLAAVGLQGFGRQSGFLERQIARWTKQWQLSKARDLPAVERLIEWLPRHLPGEDETTLVHGDFRPGNVIFDPKAPRIAAVLDWELSTLGHPLADLAHTCTYIWMMTSDEHGGGLADVDLAAEGLPSMDEFVATYHRHAGRAGGLSDFYLAFALFRSAVIFEGIADRARRGNAAAANAEEVGKLAPKLAERGAALIDRV